MRIVALLLAGAAVLPAQPFGLGIKAGVPLTDFFKTASSPRFGFNSNTKRYIIGPSVELRLPKGLGVEFDALFRRINYSSTSLLVDVLTAGVTTGNAWEFPLMLKYRAGHGPAKPFVNVGVSFDSIYGLSQTVVSTIAAVNRVTRVTSSDVPEYRNKVNKGFVIGGGVDVHALLIHISPEIRYTRWGTEVFSDPQGLLRSQRNQAEFLLGISF